MGVPVLLLGRNVGDEAEVSISVGVWYGVRPRSGPKTVVFIRDEDQVTGVD